MTHHDAQGRELFVCSECKCRRIGAEYKLDRHGHRRKGCIICKQRREDRKCPHGMQTHFCLTCSPEKFCEHGKCKVSHTCSVCDKVGTDRRKHIRNARVFAEQPGGWPFEHVRLRSKLSYDAIVDKWVATFAKMLEDGEIDEDHHAKILVNLKPWGVEGNANQIHEPQPAPAKTPQLTDDDITELLTGLGL